MNTVVLEANHRIVELEPIKRTVSLEITYTESEYYFLSQVQAEKDEHEVKLWSSE